MPLEQDLTTQLVTAMKAKDAKTAEVIRMLKTKIMERRTSKGFTGEMTDEVVTDVIAAYRKQLSKAREEYGALGEKGAETVVGLTAELEIVERFLPKGLSEDEVRAAVRAAIAAAGGQKDPKMAGKLVGEIVKANRGKVEPGVVKKIADEELK